jgi:hypothetical protein
MAPTFTRSLALKTFPYNCSTRSVDLLENTLQLQAVSSVILRRVQLSIKNDYVQFQNLPNIHSVFSAKFLTPISLLSKVISIYFQGFPLKNDHPLGRGKILIYVHVCVCVCVCIYSPCGDRGIRIVPP